MDKYTPTTEQVRDQYAVLERLNNHAEYSAEFDRWFAEVIRKAKKEAWTEGVADRDRYDYPENPYREGETE